MVRHEKISWSQLFSLVVHPMMENLVGILVSLCPLRIAYNHEPLAFRDNHNVTLPPALKVIAPLVHFVFWAAIGFDRPLTSSHRDASFLHQRHC